MNARLVDGRSWRIFFRAGILFVVLSLIGCATAPPPEPAVSQAPDFFAVGNELARQLTTALPGGSRGRTLIFTTITDLDHLQQPTRFGRALSEALSTGMFRQGFRVVEMRKGDGIVIGERAGELILSRDAARLSREHRADAIVAGTYSLTPESVLINLKLLAAASQEVLSVASLELERTYAINAMLADGGAVDARLSGREM